MLLACYLLMRLSKRLEGDVKWSMRQSLEGH
jgi:hypothetical protein